MTRAQARRASLLLAELASLLAEVADDGAEGEQPAPAVKPRVRASPRVAPLVAAPSGPVDDLTAARARKALCKLGFRRP